MASNQPTYFLRYFDLRARGEPIRWILKVAGVDYKEERIAFEEWKDKKTELEWRKCPVLVVNGVQLHQTTVIARYLGKIHSLAPSDPWENARIEEIVEGFHDITSTLGTAFFARRYKKEDEMRENFEAARERIEEVAQIVEKYIRPEGWIRSKKMTWVDIFIAAYMDTFDYYFEGTLAKTEKLQKMVDEIRQFPEIKSWIETRPSMHPFELKQ